MVLELDGDPEWVEPEVKEPEVPELAEPNEDSKVLGLKQEHSQT